MATHDYVLANQSGSSFRTDLNNALAAVVTGNSSGTEPSTTYSYMEWNDTSNGVKKIRNSSNNAWVELFQLDGTLTMEDGAEATPGLAFKDDLNTGIWSSAADTFNISTAGSKRIEITSGGNVGIGCTPARDFQLYRSSGNAQFSITSGTSNSAYLNLGDTDDDNIGGIYYDNGNNRIVFRANTTDIARMESDGTLRVIDGDLKIATAGHGIDFSANSHAGGMTSETLDGYEEGTWTCGLFDQSSGGNEFSGYTGDRVGNYTKIGDTVTAWFYARTNGSLSGITSSNQLFIQGLPFTCSSAAEGVIVAIASSTQATAQSTLGTIFAQLMASSTYIRIKKNFGDTSSPYSMQSLLISEWEGGNGANIQGTITYKV